MRSGRRFCVLGFEIIIFGTLQPAFRPIMHDLILLDAVLLLYISRDVDVLSPNFGIRASLSMLVREVHGQGVRHANGN
jgi:hypothetical protein